MCKCLKTVQFGLLTEVYKIKIKPAFHTSRDTQNKQVFAKFYNIMRICNESLTAWVRTE